MKNKSEIKIGAILSYIQMAFGVVVNLLYTPLMIRILGQSEYGLYNTVSSTISILSLLNLGFNSSYIRFFSKYKVHNDEINISRLNGLFLIVFSIIGLIAFICGIYITLNLEIVFSNGLTQNEYSIARVLFFLLIINLSVSFPMSVFGNIISAYEKFIFLKSLSILRTVVSPLLTLPILLMGYGSIGMVIVSLSINLIVDTIYLVYVFAVLKQKFLFSNFEKGIFKSLFGFTIFIAINMIVDQINLNIDKVLLARYKGTFAVAVYAVGHNLYAHFQQFSTSISSLFTPRVHTIVNNYCDDPYRQRKELTSLFTKVGRIQFVILGLVGSGLVFFGESFIYFWVGDGYQESYFVLILLVIPSMIPLIQNIGIEIQRAQNKHKFRSIIYLLMAFANLFMSIYLCQLFGAVGSAFGTSISLILANGFAINIYYHKRCNIDVFEFWKEILKMLIGLVIPFTIGCLFAFNIPTHNIFNFIFGILFYSIVYFVFAMLFSCNNFEKDLFLSPLYKLFKIKRKKIINL